MICSVGLASKTIARAGALGALLWSAAGISPAAGASAAAAVSANWAGYVAVSHFRSVSGSWQQPSANCSAHRETASAVWVGLGGYNPRAHALEQIGTAADCAGSGAATYSGWYELLPAGPVSLKLKVAPGDRMSASVSVAHRAVTLRIRDLSSGAHFVRTLRARSVDSSSAEWIVEAPASCGGAESCQIVPLTDFGEVLFSSATATGRARTSPVADSGWSPTALELLQPVGAGAGGASGGGARAARSLVVATPSSTTGPAGAFSVGWQEQQIQGEAPSAPTLPGLSA